MRVIIAGSRTIIDYDLLEQSIHSSKYKITEVVSGCAAGVDTLGEKWARNNNIPIVEMPADWDNYGISAGAIRNKQMAEYADAAIVVWDGESSGSKHMIKTMQKLKKPCYIKTTLTTIEDFI